MSDEMLVLNDMSRAGYRRIHVMRMGEEPARVKWIAGVVPAEVDEDQVTAAEYREEGLDVYHLWLHWYAREMVRLVVGSKSVWSCWWYVGEMTLRVAADCAATVFRRNMGRWPERFLVRSLPKGVESGTLVMTSDQGEVVGLPLEVEGWVPAKIVVAM